MNPYSFFFLFFEKVLFIKEECKGKKIIRKYCKIVKVKLNDYLSYLTWTECQIQ